MATCLCGINAPMHKGGIPTTSTYTALCFASRYVAVCTYIHTDVYTHILFHALHIPPHTGCRTCCCLSPHPTHHHRHTSHHPTWGWAEGAQRCPRAYSKRDECQVFAVRMGFVIWRCVVWLCGTSLGTMCWNACGREYAVVCIYAIVLHGATSPCCFWCCYCTRNHIARL